MKIRVLLFVFVFLFAPAKNFAQQGGRELVDVIV